MKAVGIEYGEGSIINLSDNFIAYLFYKTKDRKCDKLIEEVELDKLLGKY